MLTTNDIISLIILNAIMILIFWYTKNILPPSFGVMVTVIYVLYRIMVD